MSAAVLIVLLAAIIATVAPWRGAAEASVTGATMSLSIDGQVGKVKAGEAQTFTVTVHADAIPDDGYLLVQALVDFGDTGLSPLGNQQAIWPDCHPDTLVTGSVENAEFVGCLNGLIAAPPSHHKGPIFSFDAGCGQEGTSHTIALLSYGHPHYPNEGALYYTPEVIPAEHSGDFVADEIEVNCVQAKQPDPGDTDGDGCADMRENGPDEKLGGQRDYLNPWDFYDVLGPGLSLTKDGKIDLPNDVLPVILNYTGNSGYTPGEPAAPGTPGTRDIYDRGPSTGPNPWNMTAPDGKIDLPNDILGLITQRGHDCR